MNRENSDSWQSCVRAATIFGGKITDCINIGDEIIELAKSLGVDVDEKYRTWYGEPDDGGTNDRGS